MLTNYLKIALRNLLKNRIYSLINVVGLAMGLFVSVLILMFVMHEFSYDKFHKDQERIFRIRCTSKMGDESTPGFYFNAQLGPMLKQYNPQVVDQVRVVPVYSKVVIKNPTRPSEIFIEKDFLYADPSFFSVFSFKMTKGSATELSKPFTMVISERAAQKYFGDSDPVGKSLIFQSKHTIQIVGVAENPPSNSSIKFDFVTSLATFPKLDERNKNIWELSSMSNTYLLLDSDKSVPAVTKNIKREYERTKSYNTFDDFRLENLGSIYLDNNLTGASNIGLINIFAGIAALILFLALFNYINLTTARATLRAKEVGVRKVVGAGRAGLVKQFYIESFLLCAISFGLAFVLVAFLKDSFYDFLDIRIDSSFLFSTSFVACVGGLFIISSLVAGSYPALILSGFVPLETLKGRTISGYGGLGVRQFFMVFQFVVSIALIIGSLIVKTQLSYMQEKDLGFLKDQVLTIPLAKSADKSFFAIRDDIKDVPGVREVSVSQWGFFDHYVSTTFENHETKKPVSVAFVEVDPNFVKTLKLRYKITPETGVNSNRPYFLLNQVAVKALGLKDNPVGEKVMGDDEVAGVVKDFNFRPLQSQVEPCLLYVVSDTTNFLAGGASAILHARLDPATNIEDKVAAIGEIFKKYNKEQPFEYYFLNDAFDRTFKKEIRLSQMFAVFTGFAIFIACMGLFGLVAFTAESRTKEIGIRKVLGASVGGIVALLSRDFVKLVLLAMVMAAPIAWYFMEKWLEDFPYRIHIPIWIFVASGLVSIVIALLTISFQAVKAALKNPVETLRNE